MVDKITNPPSQKGVIDKINEVIDNMGGTITVDQTYDGTSTNPQSGTAIAGAKFIQNNATGSNLAIGSGATATSGIAIGASSKSTNSRGIAIGELAYSVANNAIQIGAGQNNTASSLKVGFGTDNNYQLLDGTTGLIPDARISSNIARTSAIPTTTSALTNDSGYITKSVNDLTYYTLSSSLATVATSGSYNDLSNTPTIPTVNDATLTINQGGVQKGTFTANASSNVTIDLDAGGSDIVGKLPITVQETQAGGATNIDTSNGYIKGTYNNIASSYTVATYTANLQNTSISTSPSTIKELFTGNVSYFDVPTDFGQRATSASGSLVSDVIKLGGYSSLNSNYNPMILWGELASDGNFTPVVYCKAYGAGNVVGYVDSVANSSTSSVNLAMAAAETTETTASSSTSASYEFTISLLTNGNMRARYDRYNGTAQAYVSRDLTPTSVPSVYTNFLKINCARVFLKGNATSSYLPTVNDTTLTKDGTVTSWKVTDTSQAGLTIGINIDSTPTSASTNAITSGGVYTALGNKQDTLVSGTNIKTINSTSLLGSGDIAVLQNTATGTGSLTINGTATSYDACVNIGNSSSANGNMTTVVGYSANGLEGATAIGRNAHCSTYGFAGGFGASANSYATAMGASAKASASSAIQIGYGTNSSDYTLSVGFYHSSTPTNYELLDGSTGLIPDARISTNIARTSQIPTVPTDLDDLSDVTITSATSGNVLEYNGSNWVNSTTATVYPVVEVSPASILPAWYRIYAPDSTGYRWCEMGDLYYKGSTTAGDNTINFLKNFKDLNFEFTPTPLHSTANLNQYQMYEKYPDRTVSSVNLHVTAAVFGYSWTAEGYIANEV